jgi:MULE transposase domain
MARQMNATQSKLIITALNTGSMPRAAAALLRATDPTFTASSQDIKNLKNKTNRELLGGRSLIDTLFDSLQSSAHTFYYRLGNEDEVLNLMIANPTSITLARKYNHITLMDCTYKANKYNMPVLNVIGMTSFNKSFFICFVFMKQETEENYKWALEKNKGVHEINKMPKVIATDRELSLMNNIQRVFPHAVNLLCIWHIQKMLLQTAKGFLKRTSHLKFFWTNGTL